MNETAEKNSSEHLILDVCREVAKNAAMSLPPVRAWRLRQARTSSRFGNQDQELERYAFFPLRHLLPIVGSVKGLRIVEIGPGDHLATGLSLLAAGAASYTAFDRFAGDYSGEAAKEWYRGVQAGWSRNFPDFPWPDYLDANDFPEAYPDRVKLPGMSVESASQRNGEMSATGRYDVVCSFQVAEHVSDINAFALMNARFVAPSGVAVHRVDFGPHDCWINYDDKLTFLRFPDWLWRLMGSNRGTPNRHRFHELHAAFETAGLKVEAVGLEKLPQEIDDNKLARRFRGMPADSLPVMTATFICRPSR